MCMPRYFGRKLSDGVKEEKKVKKADNKEKEKNKKVVCQTCVEFE